MNITINNNNKSTTKRVLWGIILLLTVAAIIVSALGLWEFPQMSVGSIIWTVLSLLILIEGISSRSFVEICMPLAILAIVWKQYIGLANVNNWLLVLCGLLLSIGLKFVFPSFKKKVNINVNGQEIDGDKWNHFSNNCNNDGSNTNFKDATFESTGDNDCAEVNFGSQTKYYKSQTFESACIEANFASIKAYFTDAKMLNDSAHVSVECNFGSAELFIPKEWKVQVKGDGAFSGVNERGEVEWDGIHTLYLSTEVNFGGLTIHHV